MTATLDPDRLLDVLEFEGTLLAASAEEGDPDRPVPGCPGLTLGETVRHLGSVYRMVLTWIRTGDRPTRWQRQPTDDQSVEDYLRDGLRSLLGELAAHAPTEPCPTWHPHLQEYGFWRRRMAHETTVHRVDVQSAAGPTVAPVPADVAIDGVDEALHLWFTHRLAALGVSGTRHATVAVHTADRTWLATVGTDRTSAADATESDIAAADAVITAAPQELYLWLWGRRAVFVSTVISERDYDAVAQLWALLRLATR